MPIHRLRWGPAGSGGPRPAWPPPGRLLPERGLVYFYYSFILLLLLLFALSLVMTGCRTHTRSHTHASQHRAAGRRGAQREGAARWGGSLSTTTTRHRKSTTVHNGSPPDKQTQRVSRRGQEGDGDGDEADGVVLAAGVGGETPALAPVLALTQNLLLRKCFA